MNNIGLYTYSLAAAAFTLLGVLLFFQQRGAPLRLALFGACALTSAWAATIALGTLAEYPPMGAIRLFEGTRNVAWLFVLLQLIGLQATGDRWRFLGRRWRGPLLLSAGLLSIFLAVHEAPSLNSLRLLSADAYRDSVLVIWLLSALCGLLALEQIYRNGTPAERWSLKFFFFALGTIYAYDFFMYAEALLFRQLNTELWQARGLITALVTPWLAVSIARNREWQMHLHVSRQVVFHTLTLMAAGAYLLGMASVGYFIRYLGGSWGSVLQISFLAAGVGLLFSLVFSGRLRAKTRVWLSKHFFSYRYDYREEWLKFTHALATLSDDVAEGIIATMAPLASSPAGLLFSTADETPRFLAHWRMPPPDSQSQGLGNLRTWLSQTGWVIDLGEWRRHPERYEGLELPDWLAASDSLWLVIPLVFRDRLEGVLMLKRSDFKERLNWEDRDLLKTAGRQAASHLAQQLAATALVETRQFDAFNRLSAYVVHDLKNILAQQSLIVSNAAKHRDNPDFIDDMIATVENSVGRMQRLMEQMRTGLRCASTEQLNLPSLLEQVVAERSGFLPAPRLIGGDGACLVEADRERLATVFTHLVQNAQEATPQDGSVSVEASFDGSSVVIAVSDTGRGMDEAFIRDRLFRPFDSTKGLTGMGIGVFESREYIRQLGGDIEVESTPGEGTVFRVRLSATKQTGARAGDTAEEAAA